MTRKLGEVSKRDGLTSTAYGVMTKDLIVSFISDFIEANGMSPTVQEIADGVGRARPAANKHVLQLIKEGRLTRTSGNRTIRVVPPKGNGR